MTNFGPLTAFNGAFGGESNSSGFNAIFRPNSQKTPTHLPTPVDSDHILQLSLIRENLRFLNTPALLGVPINRGSGQQSDTTLVPIFYFQYIEDTSIPLTLANLNAGAAIIHQELGMWLLQPATNDEPAVVQRLATIQHGVSIVAEGTATTIQGKPTIPPISMVPFKTDSGEPVAQPSLEAAAQGTARIPQDLTSHIKDGTITQAILDDPNKLLRDKLNGQNVTSTIVIDVDTDNGGLSNTKYLQENALCTRVQSTFFIETLNLGIFGSWPQIQYSQQVFLQIGDTTYPHITVATLTHDPFPQPFVI